MLCKELGAQPETVSDTLFDTAAASVPGAMLDIVAEALARSSSKSLKEFYWPLREKVILGKYDEALVALEAEACLTEVELRLAFLLRAQIAGLRLEAELDTYFARLTYESSHYVACAELEGEFLFTLGILMSQQRLYSKALVFFVQAQKKYAEHGLHALEGIACFNSAVCANHLNQRLSFSRSLARLQEITKVLGLPSLKVHELKLLAYVAMDVEDYEGAEQLLLHTIELCRSLKRERDWESAFSFLIYVYIKNERVLSFDPLLRPPLRPGSYFSYRVTELEYLALHPFLSPTEAVDRAKKRWKQKMKDGVGQILFMDLLLDCLTRSCEYETIRRLSGFALKVARENQQAISLVDYRATIASAMIKLGDFERGEKLLRAYESDNAELKIDRRIKNVNALRRDMQLRPSAMVSVDGEDPIRFYFDTQEIEYRGHRVSLLRRPMLVQMFMAFRKEKSLSKETLFLRVYQRSYNPSFHESRFLSLIQRARAIFPGIRLVSINNDRIEIARNFLFLSRSLPDFKEDDFVFLKSLEGQESFTLSEVERRLGIPRRTLQWRLSRLVEAKRVERLGKARATRYLVRSVRND